MAVLEECRSSMDQEANALRSSVRDLEKTRLQARRDLQELRRQVEFHPLLHMFDIWSTPIRVSPLYALCMVDVNR